VFKNTNESVVNNVSSPENINPPIGLHWRTADFIKALKSLSIPSFYKRFPVAPTVYNRQPKGVETIKWKYNPVPPRPFLASVPGGRVYGTNGSVIAPDNKLLWDVSFEYHTYPHKHPIFKEKSLPPITHTTETLAVVTFQVSFNYFHWMFDVLPRLELLRQSGIKFDRIVINRGILYRKDYCEFQDESLKLLGISKDRLIECHPQTHIQAKQLIVCTGAGYTAHVPKNVCQFLRREFLEKSNLPKVKGYERIFISREDSSHRKIVNEDEVVKVLKKYGFKKVTLSTLSFQEKIKIFNSAETIISPHGAGLTNLVFCNPGTKVIELFAPRYTMPCFYIISNHMNLDYYYLVGEAVIPNRTSSTHEDPIVVDLDKLQRTLEMAEIV
jgi:capsular polysaccharide biosynthesis protein